MKFPSKYKLFHQANTCENDVCKMSAIFFWPQLLSNYLQQNLYLLSLLDHISSFTQISLCPAKHLFGVLGLHWSVKEILLCLYIVKISSCCILICFLVLHTSQVSGIQCSM